MKKQKERTAFCLAVKDIKDRFAKEGTPQAASRSFVEIIAMEAINSYLERIKDESGKTNGGR